MVVLNKIYTKTGDEGKTALANGERRAKDDLRVAAYVTVDETNSILGVARTAVEEDSWLSAAIKRIQNDLFDLGADLATPDDGTPLQWEPIRVSAVQVSRLETEIDEQTSSLEPLRSFILPGGSVVSAHLHHARTVSRRAERKVVALRVAEPGTVSEQAAIYLNRLSDLLFVLARAGNNGGKDDVLWVPGENR
jgi:cob(I)alamin adenosyltransferase